MDALHLTVTFKAKGLESAEDILVGNCLASKDPPEDITPRVTMSTMISEKSIWNLVDFASPWQAHHSFIWSHFLTPSIKSQNDYLWSTIQQDLLCLPKGRSLQMSWLYGMVHSCMPFHRISQWTGGFFEDTSLTKIGLEIHLGHQGKPCPEVTDDWYDTDDEGDNFAEGQWVPLVNDPQTTTVVDTSGVHSLMIRFCRCASALGPDMQLFEFGLFPASFTLPNTVFTFAVLDDFLLDNLECGMSAMNYYSKLRRITSSVFPHLVPDRYRELMRVGRQWRQLKQLKWHGFAHEKQKPKAGELALFCPACPQPGVNVNLAERNVSNPAWLYSRSLVMDGNFKAEHMFPANPTDEVALTDGLGFMVGDGRYKLHLAEAQDISIRRMLHVTILKQLGLAVVHALDMGVLYLIQWWTFKRGKVGQRQMNMDYVLCQALGYNTNGIDWALTFYDINCQYHKHLHQRVEESPYLDLPWGMEVIPGIGLWHVHGHQDKCYVRYASNFITGAARIDGEIMETLWAPLNIISPLARGMSTPHRKECLDFQMNDCNFMKMIQMIRDSQHAFDQLSETANDDTLVKWEAEAAAAQDDRLENPSTMDIYEVKMTKAPTRKQQELHLLTRQARWPAGEIHCGAATWLASGITLEEAQVALLIDVKKLGRRPTNAQKLAIAQCHDRLQGQIDEFVRVAVTFLGDQLDEYDKLDLMTMMLDAAELDSAGSSSDDPDRPDDEDRYDTPVKFTPKTLMHQPGAPINIIERRVNLADKAVLFRTTVRSAKSQARSTCAWARVHSVDKILHLNVQMYSKCRSQLVHLSANDLLVKLRPLEKADLKATTVVADPNARGQRNSTLAWFWSIDVQGDSTSNDWMNEFYCVHWLRMLALRDRWAEELLLVGRMQEVDANQKDKGDGEGGRVTGVYSATTAFGQCHVPRSPAYKASFIRHLQWEVDHPWQIQPSPNQEHHRVVLKYAHDWWKDHFDTLGFALPSLDVNEVLDMMADHFEQLPMGAMLLPGPAVAGQVEGDPLLNQILAVKARVQHLGDSLEKMLQEKTMMAAAATSSMSELEGSMDELEEALLTSRRP
ncbi:hypothetical protein F4604DRAFT_1687361 [Suillus subluteus]|nr:hypothetical protein F4604DRAFT_1687361 [Suillus subluteus]